METKHEGCAPLVKVFNFFLERRTRPKAYLYKKKMEDRHEKPKRKEGLFFYRSEERRQLKALQTTSPTAEVEKVIPGQERATRLIL